MQSRRKKPVDPKFLWLVALAVVLGLAAAFWPLIRKDAAFSAQKQASAKDYLQQALEAEGKNDWPNAIWNFRQVLEFERGNRAAVEHLAKLYIQTGQIQQALEYSQKLTEISPDSPVGFYYLGIVYTITQQQDKAFQNYQKTAKIDPKNAEAYFNLGFISETKGQFSEAAAYYQKALEADPKHARSAYNLGNVYAALQKNDEAIGAYKTAIANDSHYMDAFVNLSILLTQAGDYAEAVKYLDEARLLGYEPPEAYLKELEPYRKQ